MIEWLNPHNSSYITPKKLYPCRPNLLWNMFRKGLTFDDVLIIPKKSPVSTRKQIDVSTQLTSSIPLNIPIVASNMDTVCESNMAIKMARLGGIGIIHRFLSVEDQVAEIRNVKRAESLVIENPYTISQKSTIEQALSLMEEKNVSGLLVADKDGTLEGILTRRDVNFADPQDTVGNRMTSKVVTGSMGINSEDAIRLMDEHRVEKLPLVSKGGKITGLITLQDVRKRKQHPLAVKDSKGRLRVGAAVGVKGDYLRRTEALVEADVDVIVVDIAHGHSDLAINTVKQIKQDHDIEVIAGNVATAAGTADLISAGADGVKVGVGPGSICITRIVAGSGVPQLTAIIDSASVAREEGIPTIADGGIRKSGDVAKALLAGADTVMIGSLLAGTEESPGLPLLRNGKRYKVVRGMASFGASLGREVREKKGSFDDADLENVVPEGVEALVPYKGSARDVIFQLVGGLRSGISYAGGRSLKDAREVVEFIEITNSGQKESSSHDVETI